MGTYKTPGVYIEEIPRLPASVARVATAIPVFIGYTEIARGSGGKDLTGIPTKIDSMVDYENMYGGASPYEISSITLDSSGGVADSDISLSFYTFDAVRMFYSNGGGQCYIISLGGYGATPAIADFTTALAALAREDEPTLIVSPDAVLLDSDFYTFQQAALGQAAKLQDRFVVMDVPESGDYDADIEEFRDGVGMNDLKYAAAYTPYVESSYDRGILYSDFDTAISLETGGTLDWNLYDTSEGNVLNSLIAGLEESVTDYNAKALVDPDALVTAYNDQVAVVMGEINAAVPVVGDINTEMDTLADIINITVAQNILEAWATAGDSLGVEEYTLGWIGDNIATGASSNLWKYVIFAATGFDLANTVLGTSPTIAATVWDDHWDYTGKADDDIRRNPTPTAGAQEVENARFGLTLFTNVFNELIAAIRAVRAFSRSAQVGKQNTLKQLMPQFKGVMDHVEQELAAVPPSGAIVGAYAYVDGSRGVWKAPANVSLAGIRGLTEQITHDEQEGLNVDTTAGKSINALREFVGKGFLIWGARTLAGNDNEWRYVPVRRLFIMAEESIRKATEFVVFEPNDAKTWIRVKGMIGNFLTGLWRDGALAGAKPDDAFYVKAGLGETMTAQDVLEGRLIVEIGMAAVRPAEFIILRFMHKLQES